MRIQIPHDWQTPGVFQKRLGDDVGRQRAMHADGQMLLVLHEPPTSATAPRVGRLFWRDTDGTWRGKPLGDGIQGLKRHVAEFAERADALEKQWQEADNAGAYYELIRLIAPLHRTSRHLHAVLQEARDLVAEDRDLINLRDRAGEIERTLELLHGDAKTALEFTVAQQAEYQAQRTYEMAVAAHRLNLLAATFFPLATLSAIFGAIFGMMSANQDHGLQGVNTPALFWGAMGVSLLSGILLGRVIARRPRPLDRAPAAVRQRRRRG